MQVVGKLQMRFIILFHKACSCSLLQFIQTQSRFGGLPVTLYYYTVTRSRKT
jgi:hypothetical protein